MQAIFQMRLETHTAPTTDSATEPGNLEPSRMLLFVHAAAHDATVQAVTSAAAQHGATLQPRYAVMNVPHGISCGVHALPCKRCFPASPLHIRFMSFLPGKGWSCSTGVKALHCRRYDLQRVEIKGALSDRAVAAALSQADLPWLPGVHAAARSQASEQLFQLLQATGITLPYLDRTYAGALCMPYISAIFTAVYMACLFDFWAGTQGAIFAS